MHQQQQMIAELARQGQAEVEQRMTMMKAYSGNAKKVNPLNDFYKNDREICRLEVDAAGLESMFLNAYLSSPLCWCPGFWPHQLIMCLPCAVMMGMSDVAKAAAAHRLILCENSVKYEVDPYPQVLQSSRLQPTGYACFGPVLCNPVETAPIRETFPLSEVASASVEECNLVQCGSKVAPDTFVLRLGAAYGGSTVGAAIDMPKDGEAFATRLMQQVSGVKEMGGQAVPAEWNEYKAAIGFAGGLGALGGMVAGAFGAGGAHVGHGAGGEQMMAMMMQAQAQAQAQANSQQGQANVYGVNVQMGGIQPEHVTAYPVQQQTMDRAPTAPVASTGNDLTSQLGNLADLRRNGALTDDEYSAAKKRLLS